MTDLRTGLVGAMADALVSRRSSPFHWSPADFVGGPNGEAAALHQNAVDEAEAALNVALGFLTDNAEAWEDAAMERCGLPLSRDTTLFLAALSDSRDTGEKP